MDKIREAYEASISTDGISYLFLNTTKTYHKDTNVKIKEEFINYKVFPSFEIEVHKNELTRTFYESIKIKGEEYIFKVNYTYITQPNLVTELFITAYDDKEQKVPDEVVMMLLGIEETYHVYDYVPYLELNVGKGMLPNILFIEDSLAENVYFQDLDLTSAQTHTYIPESQTFEITTSGQEGTKNRTIQRSIYFKTYNKKWWN